MRKTGLTWASELAGTPEVVSPLIANRMATPSPLYDVSGWASSAALPRMAAQARRGFRSVPFKLAATTHLTLGIAPKRSAGHPRPPTGIGG